VGAYGRAPKGDGGLNSRACFRIQLTYLVGGAMVERLRTLSVEPPKGSLSVEHLKVMAASRACFRILSSSIDLFGGGAYGRAPKGDGGLNSRACFRIQLTYLVGGLWSSASGPYQSSPLKGPYQSST